MLVKLSSDGFHSTATWLYNLSPEPKPLIEGLSTFLKRHQNIDSEKSKSKLIQEVLKLQKLKGD